VLHQKIKQKNSKHINTHPKERFLRKAEPTVASTKNTFLELMYFIIQEKNRVANTFLQMHYAPGFLNAFFLLE
jgi:hypothetical protein